MMCMSKFLDIKNGPGGSKKAPTCGSERLECTNEAEPMSPIRPGIRRNSQVNYSKPMQTIIIFDWDDTLFPTTYMRDDMDLSWRKPIKQHSSLSREQVKEITNNISSVEVQAEKILRLAASLGKVVFVTLARSPWVFETCRN